jgi:Cft2 family RNA processing exonuclease
MRAPITFYSLGAAEEVTGSKHVLELGGRSYLIDCGAFQGSRAEADRKNRNFGIPVDRIEGAVLTHGHYDHCGLLPLLSRQGYRGNIYATPASRDLASLIMMDSAKIQAHDADYFEAGEWLDALDTSRLKEILLVHGEPKAQAAFKQYLTGKGYAKTEIVRYGRSYELT